MVKLIECINTWQGEGADVGQRMLLCRFKYCNKKCPWCDTLVKMRALQEAEYSLVKLQEIIDEEKTGLMITGGEPTYSNQLDETITMLNVLKYPTANVETNGLGLLELIKLVDPDKSVRYSFSPKLFTEEDCTFAFDLAANVAYNPNVIIKLVVNETDDITNLFLKELVNIFPVDRIYLMPMGKNKEEMFTNAPHMFNLAEQYKTNISSRMHLVYDFV